MPALPATGEVWDELDNLNNLVNQWFWNGTYWLSQQIYEKEHIISSLGTGTGYVWSVPIENNIFFKTFQLTFNAGALQNNTSFWSIKLYRNPGDVLLSTLETKSMSIEFNNVQSTLNFHLNLSSPVTKGLTFVVNPTGSPGGFNGSIKLIYRSART